MSLFSIGDAHDLWIWACALAYGRGALYLAVFAGTLGPTLENLKARAMVA